ncbi:MULTISPECIES: bifunctional 4-hydroxy-2-oxoglutarate aldolase/2-dehydro-3-deoxy-phosphogluconate aldolase [unclassified Paenibacillus]|uniref:bifunctional 4-hydroxy-2-oxoglutarate aldolase/2-dehydro-3-deoxy-phosphogluconate aldolase n=1 Tax=unclassified Paenibacillus TaxID=185978 RepID=UPI00104D87EB|nr:MULTISPECIES: bifunctional 4-hydroxy-2-oxoglutarate aldolase/2-dehydro-3-deoxy-phosphogluconate aldolase [unclassified Paenibacillus]NIK70926.1 2-dehydro-3-deoxyphosphogluconate aldolase/(4S)-4-hydroxy-2-oxoglutarate aldolase [Paenibacillus sp. BK720]TCM93097.1 2-dehydro-3-deoxyphosphogluconate aldolase/(4S)-4-hydroxy-2-oxoglutarate aldolase [Paenibacillus sp. BK033]
MSKMLDLLLEHKIVAILRGIEDHQADAAGQAMIDGGIRLMEITMNTPGAAVMIERWRSRFDGQASVGAGTVLDVEMAKTAVAAGAEFLISPNLDEDVVAYGRERGVSVWPGVMTPTEIVKAWKAGAEAVKLFPMGTLGTKYLSEIRGPLDSIPIMATGGVDLHNIADYFAAGANAVGMGGKLLNLDWVREGRFDLITGRARQFVEAVSKL